MADDNNTATIYFPSIQITLDLPGQAHLLTPEFHQEVRDAAVPVFDEVRERLGSLVAEKLASYLYQRKLPL
jgi:hypothetical protein